MYNFVDLINSDLNDLKAPFIPEQILPTVKYSINDTHLAKILSQRDRNGFKDLLGWFSLPKSVVTKFACYRGTEIVKNTVIKHFTVKYD